MTEAAGTAPSQSQGTLQSSAGGFFRSTEIDPRLFGMLVALAAMLVGFQIFSGGTFLTPVNMMTLAIQASGTAIVATGMVLIIVSRNIDLSVGSQIGVLTMLYALLMADWLPTVGLQLGDPLTWIVALALGIAVGAAIGGFQGFIISYIGVPSFIVTLGGLLALRGVVWMMSNGAAVSGIDETFRKLGGGYRGSVGGDTTWFLAVIVCLAIIAYLAYSRRQRARFGFPLRPVWADVLLGAVSCGVVLFVAYYANEVIWPSRVASEFAAAQGIVEPEGGLRIPVGFPWPLLLVVGTMLAMTFLANRRRFGRYVYAYGGNPDAADLAGINTRRTIMKTFILIGVLCALAAAIAAARLNGATLDIGTTEELYVIAAAVVGGTSFAGGIGTISGAVLGAVVMQTLAYGLAFNGVNAAQQNIVAGVVLVVAVGFDTYNRRRGGLR
ncbi:MAG TPA: hypothetical protein VIF44_00275 [Candidatus Limnocylindrales bacterium]